MNLPNALTLARIFLVPLLVVVLVTKFEGRLIFGVRMELNEGTRNCLLFLRAEKYRTPQVN